MISYSNMSNNWICSFVNRHFFTLVILCGILFYIYGVITTPLETYEYFSKSSVDKAIQLGSFSFLSSGGGYDLLISILSLMSELDLTYFNLIPAGMVLYSSTFLAIFLRISSSRSISYLGIILMFLSQTVTPDLQIHHIGFGLIFNFALVLGIESISYKLKIAYGTLLIIPVYFISYNASALYALLYISLIIIYLSLYYGVCRNIKLLQLNSPLLERIKLLFFPTIISAITIFGLSNFVYERYFSHLVNSASSDYTLISKLYDLIFHWFFESDSVSTSIIAEYHYTSSLVSSYVTYLSYSIMGIIFIIYLLFVLSHAKDKRDQLLNKWDIIIVCLILTSSIFLIVRLFNNDLAFTLFINTTFIIAIRMLTLFPHKKKLVLAFLVLIFAFSITNCVASIGDDEKYYGNSYYPAYTDIASWTVAYLPEYGAIYSDLGSVGYLKYISQKYYNIQGFRAYSVDYVDILDIARNSPHTTDNFEKYVLINYVYKRMSLSMVTWELIKNWAYINDNISFNQNYNSLYCNGLMNVLKTTTFFTMRSRL